MIMEGFKTLVIDHNFMSSKFFFKLKVKKADIKYSEPLHKTK